MVINRYPAETADIAEETNPARDRAMGRDVPVLCLVPEEPVKRASVPVEIAAAVEQVDWGRMVGKSKNQNQNPKKIRISNEENPKGNANRPVSVFVFSLDFLLDSGFWIS